MTGEGLICKLKNTSPIEGADLIVSANMFGETIIITKDVPEGTLGILFDCSTQLSHEFVSNNNLYRHSHLNADKTKEGYFEDNRRVRPIKMRGVKVSGFFIPIDSVSFTRGKTASLKEGMLIKDFAGVPICKKYVVKERKPGPQNKKGKAKENLVPHFYEHIDTDHLLRCLHKVKEGDLAIVTTKVHGTSCRAGYLPLNKSSWYDSLLTRLNLRKAQPYVFCVGSRRVVKYVEGQQVKQKGSYYNEDIWTKSAKKYFDSKLHKGEEVFYEIVGYLPSGEAIMPVCDNKKLKKHMEKKEYDEFIKEFGDKTRFTYGVDPDSNEYRVFVYRITQNGIDISWDQVKRRCEEIGVDHVPEVDRFLVTKEHLNEEYWQDRYEDFRCKHFPSHIREGVVLRSEGGSMIPTLLKYKNFTFKVLENIIKDTQDDIEEEN